MKAQFTNRITVTHGTEGPRHDPYGFEEITIDSRNGKITFHDSALGCSLRLEDHDRGIVGDEHDLANEFEFLTGVTPHIAIKVYNQIPLRKAKAHLRKCHSGAEAVPGYPGETLMICSKCREILDCDFNESAVI